MARIVVVHAGNHGNTRRMAEALAEGAGGHPGAEPRVMAAADVAEGDFEAARGVAIGSPVRMSDLDREVKRPIDEVVGPLWRRDALMGAGAAFATGGGHGSAGAGCGHVMVSILDAMAEAGTALPPMPKTTEGHADGGLQWGPHARSAGPHMERTGIEDRMPVPARRHGPHLARLASALDGPAVFAA